MNWRRIKSKRPTPRHIVAKLSKTKDSIRSSKKSNSSGTERPQ